MVDVTEQLKFVPEITECIGAIVEKHKTTINIEQVVGQFMVPLASPSNLSGCKAGWYSR